jgi:large subunit ribosomal protein L10
MIKDFRKAGDRPQLKAAYVDSAVFLGDEQLDALTKLKSKQDLLGEVIGLLQSPARNLVSALQSGGSTIAGLVKALEERG